MASDVFTIMARKNVSPFLICKIIVIPDISHTQRAKKKLPPKAAIFASIEKEIISNEQIGYGAPCSVQQQNVI